MRFRLMLAAWLGLVPGCGLAHAQPGSTDPDWPCQQLLVPKLAAASYWQGTKVPPIDDHYHDDPKLEQIITTAVDRATPDSAAVSALRALVHHAPPSRREAEAARLFGYVVAEANDQRQQVIGRIDSLSRRQQALSHTIDRINKEIAATPDQTPQRADLTGQRDFNIQTFDDAQHTIRYECEVPGLFDQRLGIIAKALQAR